MGDMTTNMDIGRPARTGDAPLVLIVDDDPRIAMLLEDVLLDEGYRVLTASDGLAALDVIHAQATHPDLVLTDIMMPRLDGLGLLRRLKADPRHATAPVVVVSCVLPTGGVPGAAATLSKPFEVDDVIAVVRRCCRTGRGVTGEVSARVVGGADTRLPGGRGYTPLAAG